MDSWNKRASRYPIVVTNYVQRRTKEGCGAHHISEELKKLVEEPFVKKQGQQPEENPLYKQTLPPEKTVQRWCRMMRPEGDHSSAATDVESARWNSSMEANADDASTILSVLGEVASRSEGYTRYFEKATAAEVLRVIRLASGVPLYVVWLVADNYIVARQTGDSAMVEALDLFLGLSPWASADSWNKYKSLVDAGLPTVPPLLLEQTPMECPWRFGYNADEQGFMHHEVL